MMVLDLFCGGGGASMGYHRAGYEVVGVDKRPQPHYPFTFDQDDAMDLLRVFAERHVNVYRGKRVDLIHLSPPYGAHTRAKHVREAQGRQGTEPNLLTPSLRLLEDVRIPWVVESVPGAPMPKELELCGSMFGLEEHEHHWFCAHRSLILYPPGVCKQEDVPITSGTPPAYTQYIGGVLARQLLP